MMEGMTLHRQPTVELEKPFWEYGDVIEDFVADILTHRLEIIMAVLVDGQTEGVDILEFGLVQGHLRVMDGIFLLNPFTTITAILGTSITDQEQQLGLGVLFRQFLSGVSDRGAHSSRVQRRYTVYALFDPV